MNIRKILTLFALCICLALPAMAEIPQPVTGATPVVSSFSAVGELPVLVSQSGSDQGWTLNAQKICQRLEYLQHPYLKPQEMASVSNWAYHLTVTDQSGNPVDPSTVSGTLHLPFPAGISWEKIASYDISVEFFDADGKYIDDDVNLIITEDGLQTDWMTGGCTLEIWGGPHEKYDKAKSIDTLWEMLEEENLANPNAEELSVSQEYTFGESLEKTTLTYNRKTHTYTVSGGILNDIIANPYLTMHRFDTEPAKNERIHYTYVLEDITLLDYLVVHDFIGHDLTLVLKDSVRGYYDAVCTNGNDSKRWGGFFVDINHDPNCGGTSVEIINDTTLCPRGNYSLRMYMEPNYRLHVKGSGQILNSTGGAIFLSDEDEENEETFWDYRPIDLTFEVRSDNNAQAMDTIQHMIANNLKFSGSMFSKLDKKNIARVVAQRLNSDGERFGTSYQLIPVCYSEEDLAAADPNSVRLLLEGTKQQNADRLLVSKWIGIDGDHYEIDLVDADNHLIPLTGKASMYMPFPDTITVENAKNHVITFYHPTMFGDEIYTTHPKRYPDAENVYKLTVTAHGLKLNPTSFSPYIAVLDLPDADLPKTGDNSHIALWLALLALAGTAILTLKRK